MYIRVSKKDFLYVFKYAIFGILLGFSVSCSADTARFRESSYGEQSADVGPTPLGENVFGPSLVAKAKEESSVSYGVSESEQQEFHYKEEKNRFAKKHLEEPYTAAEHKVYRVRAGDTLFSIAHRFGITVSTLKKMNRLNGKSLKIGQRLFLPLSSVAHVERFNNPMRKKQKERAVFVAHSHKKNLKASRRLRNPQIIESPEPTQVAQQKNSLPKQQSFGFRWPARGKIVSRFRQKQTDFLNNGIDIFIPKGSSVKAAEKGTVLYAGDGLKQFGKTVLIKHENNLVTVYGNNSQLEVRRGDHVYRGQEIAKSGISSYAKSPQIHFEVRKNAQPVDPLKYLD